MASPRGEIRAVRGWHSIRPRGHSRPPSPPNRCSSGRRPSGGESRTSSVPALKASPSRPTVAARRQGTDHAGIGPESRLLRGVGLRRGVGHEHRQTPRHAGDGERPELLGQAAPAEAQTRAACTGSPIRGSDVMPRMMSSTSVSNSSATEANSLANDSLSARNALAPFLTTSAAPTSMTRTGAPSSRNKAASRSAMAGSASGELSDDDPRGMQEVVERGALAQELGIRQDARRRDAGGVDRHTRRTRGQRAADDQRHILGQEVVQAPRAPRGAGTGRSGHRRRSGSPRRP